MSGRLLSLAGYVLRCRQCRKEMVVRLDPQAPNGVEQLVHICSEVET